MGKATTYTDDSFYHDTSWVTWDREGKGYKVGRAVTPEGYVMVYQDEPANIDPNGRSVLRFIYKARMYHRRYNGLFTERGLAVKASQFAREIIRKEGEK